MQWSMAPTQLARSDDDELRRRGYSIGGVLGEGSYAKVTISTRTATRPLPQSTQTDWLAKNNEYFLIFVYFSF